jgi:pimeloyl-ACP methyl ester carboxylesterase
VRLIPTPPGSSVRLAPLAVAVALGLSVLPPVSAGAQEAAPATEPISIERLCPPPPTRALTFSDVAGSTFEAEILCLAFADITRGVQVGLYSPATEVSRAQMASFIARLIDTAAELTPDGSGVSALPAHDGTNRFVDVPTTNVHLANINRLAAAGIVVGGPGGGPPDWYGPTLPVSRAQMASFVARALSYVLDEDLTSDVDHFTDDDDDIHEPAIDALAEVGVVAGVGGGRFVPDRAISRGQMAALLTRALAWLEAGGHVTPLPRDRAFLPVVFVHGQSGSAQQFESQILRFTSNGYPQRLLFAYEYDTGTPTNDLERLDAFIDQVRRLTGSDRVYAVGHSRGTTVLTSYLDPATGPDGSAKVAKYVNIDGRAPEARPGGVATIGIWGEWNTAGSGFSRSDVSAQIGPDPRANFHFADKGHTEVATSAAAFLPLFEFLAETAPEHLDVVPASTDTVTIAGRALLFPQNEGYDGATVQVWSVDPGTGRRSQATPTASQVVGAGGDFGPVAVQRGAHYELAITRPDSPNVHHFYVEPFVRDNHHLRLLTSRPGEGVGALVPSSDDTTNLIVFRMRELWGDQGARSDQLLIDGVSVVQPHTSPRSAVNLVLFAFDDGDDLVTDLGKGVIPPFDSIGFVTAVDVAIPASPDGSRSVPVVQTVRGGPATTTLHVPNRPSTTHANTVLFSDWTGGTG